MSTACLLVMFYVSVSSGSAGNGWSFLDFQYVWLCYYVCLEYVYMFTEGLFYKIKKQANLQWNLLCHRYTWAVTIKVNKTVIFKAKITCWHIPFTNDMLINHDAMSLTHHIQPIVFILKESGNMKWTKLHKFGKWNRYQYLLITTLWHCLNNHYYGRVPIYKRRVSLAHRIFILARCNPTWLPFQSEASMWNSLKYWLRNMVMYLWMRQHDWH